MAVGRASAGKCGRVRAYLLPFGLDQAGLDQRELQPPPARLAELLRGQHGCEHGRVATGRRRSSEGRGAHLGELVVREAGHVLAELVAALVALPDVLLVVGLLPPSRNRPISGSGRQG